MKLKLNSHEKIIFLFLVFLLSYSLYSLSEYIVLSFNEYPIIEGLPEGITDEDDVNIDKVDYEGQLKGLNKYNLSTIGTWDHLERNIKGLKKMTQGVSLDHQKLLKNSDDTLGVKYPISTGYKCTDPYDESQDLYTYVDNTSKSGIGLIGVIGDAVGKYGVTVGDLSSATSMGASEEKKCIETTLFVKTNSGVNTKQTVHIDEKELEKIKPSNIENIKEYPKREEDEEEGEEGGEEEVVEGEEEVVEGEEEVVEGGEEEVVEGEEEVVEGETETFVNINKLLINDDLFYKDYFIFTYFLMLSLLFLYYIFIIVINN